VISDQNNINSDQKLVEGFLKTRDEQAFREIYRRNTPALYLLALRLSGGAEADAEDAVQEMWIRACRKLPEFGWKSALRTWLSGILINCVREFARKQLRRNEEELPETLSLAVSENSNYHFDLEETIKNLPTGYRHVLVLHDVEGYTHEEIARVLEISLGTSKSQLFHARKRVRSILQPEQEKR
jgi:RNA polymerase sigma-70 factor, ECF subfamily